MTACSQFDVNTATCNMSQTTGNVSPILYITKPKIRIKGLKELQTPTLSKISKNNMYIPPVGNHVNTLVRKAAVSSPITNQIHEKFYSLSHNQLLPKNKKQSSRILKLQLKERLLKERLKILEESRAIYTRKKESSSLIPSNPSCSLTDIDVKTSIFNRSQQSEIKTFETKSLSDKFTSASHIETENVSNIVKGNCNNLHFTNNSLQDPYNCFEFINVSDDSYTKFEQDLTDTSASEYTSCTENEKSTSVDNSYGDLESKGVIYLKQNILPEYSCIEQYNDVDSTGLRDGIIKASRTLINTQKALKLLSNTISRDESLPSKRAIHLLTRFQDILNTFNKGLNGIDQTISKEYKYIFSEFDLKTLLQQTNNVKGSLCNGEQKGVVIMKKDENFKKVTDIEQVNSLISRSQVASIGGKDNYSKRKKRGPSVYKSYDEKIDRTFLLPVAKAQVFVSIPRRENYQRSCKKTKTCVHNE